VEEEDESLGGETGVPPSEESSLCVFDTPCERIVDGVRGGDTVGGAVGAEGTRSAGFGNVLNVDPNDVYLNENWD
jgi:hypothetical protein